MAKDNRAVTRTRRESSLSVCSLVDFRRFVLKETKASAWWSD